MGGEGIAYHDVTPTNEGGAYRTGEGVDVATCGEGGYNLSHAKAPGEWVEYTVNVACTGTYSVNIRAAATAVGGEELYDHENDPMEWTNLAGNSQYDHVKNRLAKWIPIYNADDSPSNTLKKRS
jgi:hypothetical protein